MAPGVGGGPKNGKWEEAYRITVQLFEGLSLFRSLYWRGWVLSIPTWMDLWGGVWVEQPQSDMQLMCPTLKRHVPTWTCLEVVTRGALLSYRELFSWIVGDAFCLNTTAVSGVSTLFRDGEQIRLKWWISTRLRVLRVRVCSTPVDLSGCEWTPPPINKMSRTRLCAFFRVWWWVLDNGLFLHCLQKRWTSIILWGIIINRGLFNHPQMGGAVNKTSDGIKSNKTPVLLRIRTTFVSRTLINTHC